MNLISHQRDIEANYLYPKDPHKAEVIKIAIENFNDMNNIYQKTDENNPDKKRKIFFIFDDTTANMLSSKKHLPIVKSLFIRGRKTSISFIQLFLLY